MRICDRCHAPKNVNGPYTTGIWANEEAIHYPCVQIINLDLCLNCVTKVREAIRTVLVPIGYIEVKQNDHPSKEQSKDFPDID